MDAVRSNTAGSSQSEQTSYLRDHPKWIKYVGHNREHKNFSFCNDQSRNPPKEGLGRLDCLPLEVLQSILVRLDLFTLTAFRLVNRSAANVAESIPEYKTLLTHTIHSIRHVLRVGMGKWTSVLALYEQLYQSSCAHCGGFGNFLWILTCTRICQPCLWGSDRFVPVWEYQAISSFGLDIDLLNRLPHLSTGQPRPGQNCDQWEDFTVLWDHATVAQLALDTYGSMSIATRQARRKVQQLMGAQQDEYIRINRLLVESGFAAHDYNTSDVLPKGPSSQQGAIMKVMATVRYPSIDRHTQQREGTFYCRACKKAPLRHFDSIRKHNAQSFRKHLVEYGNIQDGQHCPPTSA